MKKILVSILFSVCATVCAHAETNIVIGKDTKVFESAVAKDEYAAVNQNDQHVILVTGMAFPVKDQKAGWYVVEYSAGLRGMVMQNVVADNSVVKAPATGTYKVANNPAETVTISNTGNDWTLKSGTKSFSGKGDGKAVVFTSADGNMKYSLTNISGKPAVFNYDNSVTKFF